MLKLYIFDATKYYPMKNTIAAAVLLLCTVISYAQVKKETLSIAWPSEIKFKVGGEEELENMHTINYIKQEEASDKWTLLVTTSAMDIQRASPAGMIEMFQVSSKEASEDSKLTVLEKSGKVKNPWVLFKVETPRFPYDPQPQAQLYYVVQGNNLLFVNYAAVREPVLTKAFTDKWAAVFKASKLVYK